jgi:uncharacterized repeat protein (TIGR03847 family)
VSRRILDFDEPDGFTAGAVGEPGDRTFYLRATKGSHEVAVVLEKEQLAILADRMLTVVDELERRGLTAIDAGRYSKSEDEASEDLAADFYVGILTIAWDEDVDRIVVEARSQLHDEGAGDPAFPDLADEDDDVPDDAPIGPDVLRVRLRPQVALRFARQAGVMVDVDRPVCPLCGKPLDPTGHRCSGPRGTDLVH